MIRFSRPLWTPTSLGASLLAWWDAERASTITQAAGAVSSWKDIVGGYDVTQATGTAQPIYGATSFGGRPGITFDGVDDCLSLTSLAWLPTGAASTEDWYAFSQAALPADATLRALGSWGSATNNSRTLYRAVSTSVNRARYAVGDGAATTSLSNNNVDFSGRHVVRAIATATQTSVDVDGVTDTGGAVVPATSTLRLRMGANAVSAAASFGQGTMNARLITGPLNAGQAAQLNAYLSARL